VTKIEVYTDGSATTSDKPGGWAFRIVGNGTAIYESSGRMENATNNDAELEAALQGLEYLKTKYDISGRDPKLDDIYLVSDSQLVLGWSSGKYRIRQKEKIERVERARAFMEALGAKPKWVKGHSTDVHNIRCDKLAKNARTGKSIVNAGLDTGIRIGTKKEGILTIWYKGVLKIVDLDANLVENHNPEFHGNRGCRLELRTDK
jgi:ribonuclease HI